MIIAIICCVISMFMGFNLYFGKTYRIKETIGFYHTFFTVEFKFLFLFWLPMSRHYTKNAAENKIKENKYVTTKKYYTQGR